MKALLIVCAYNEGSKLQESASRMAHAIRHHGLAGVQVEALIVDDGSTDGIPQEVTSTHQFHLLKNPGRKGVGYAILQAYQFGLDHGFDVMMTMAGNNKDNPDEIVRILEPIVKDEADFVQGSRYLKGGQFGNMPFYRRISTQILHPLLFSLVSGKRITDSTNGFRAVHAKILKDTRIDLTQDWLHQYELEPYLFCMAIRLKYRVMEAPVSKIYPNHKLGYTKMKPITGWWSILKPLVYLMFRMRK